MTAEESGEPPVFEFGGSWPFTGTAKVYGHPVAALTAWDVVADPDGIPVVTLTLVGAGALKLILGSESARAEVDDQTREALISLGWTPPAQR